MFNSVTLPNFKLDPEHHGQGRCPKCKLLVDAGDFARHYYLEHTRRTGVEHAGPVESGVQYVGEKP
jgi:hypothetical protein